VAGLWAFEERPKLAARPAAISHQPCITWAHRAAPGTGFPATLLVACRMRRRMLVLDLSPSPHPLPRPTPLLLLPLGDDRAAVALDDLTPEEVLAELLSRGVAVRGSRVVEA